MHSFFSTHFLSSKMVSCSIRGFQTPLSVELCSHRILGRIPMKELKHCFNTKGSGGLGGTVDTAWKSLPCTIQRAEVKVQPIKITSFPVIINNPPPFPIKKTLFEYSCFYLSSRTEEKKKHSDLHKVFSYLNTNFPFILFKKCKLV